MKETKYAAIIGGVVFLCVLSAVIGSMWLSRSGVFSNDYYIYVVFNEVKGLNKGTAVTISGSTVGSVSDIHLGEGKGIRVMLSINKGVKV